ncbi:hypothetical protein MMPV_002097 [Pyropia vietnamensis]
MLSHPSVLGSGSVGSPWAPPPCPTYVPAAVRGTALPAAAMEPTARRLWAAAPPPPPSLPPLQRSVGLTPPPPGPIGVGTGAEALPLPASAVVGRVVKATPRRHVSVGDGGPVFVCPVESCGRQFSKKWNLSAHSRLHTGARPFPCPRCGRRYMWLSSLKSHVRGCGAAAGGGRPPPVAAAAVTTADAAGAVASDPSPAPSPAPAPAPPPVPAAWTSPPAIQPVTLPPLRMGPACVVPQPPSRLVSSADATAPLAAPDRTSTPPPPAITKSEAPPASLLVPIVEPLTFPSHSISTPPRGRRPPPPAASTTPAFCRPPTVLLPPLPGIAAAQSALAAAASPVTPASAGSAAGGWASSSPPPPPPPSSGGATLGRPGGCWAALADLRRTRAAATSERMVDRVGAGWV